MSVTSEIRKVRLKRMSRTVNSWIDRSLIPPARGVDELLEELRELADTTVTTNEWQSFVQEIHQAFQTGSPNAFLRFPIIRQTLHTNKVTLTVRYLELLREKEYWHNSLAIACREVPFGHPLVEPSYPLASPVSIQHAYHLSVIVEKLGIELQTLGSLLEFGAGYGGFARLLKNLGFDRPHTMYDLPHMGALQRFYLRNVYADRLETDAGFLDNIDWVSGDPAAIPGNRSKPSLFLATFSLSETPIELREQFLPIVAASDFVCIVYQPDFGDVDNQKYFEGFFQRLSGHTWDLSECLAYPGQVYAIGRRDE